MEETDAEAQGDEWGGGADPRPVQPIGWSSRISPTRLRDNPGWIHYGSLLLWICDYGLLQMLCILMGPEQI